MSDDTYKEMSDDDKTQLKHVVGVNTPLPLIPNMEVSSFTNAQRHKIVTYAFDPTEESFGNKPLRGVCILIRELSPWSLLA